MDNERIQNLFPDESEDRLKCLANIHSYDFNYTPEAQQLPTAGLTGIDNEEHTGVMADEIKDNPAFKGVVSTDPNGYMMLDMKTLTSANTAAIGELARRVLAIEKQLGVDNGQ